MRRINDEPHDFPALQAEAVATDAGLIHLRRLKNLRYLDLSFDNVTYDGLSELLPHLSALEWLYIDYNEHVDPEQERKLSESAPGCKILR